MEIFLVPSPMLAASSTRCLGNIFHTPIAIITKTEANIKPKIKFCFIFNIVNDFTSEPKLVPKPTPPPLF